MCVSTRKEYCVLSLKECRGIMCLTWFAEELSWLPISVGLLLLCSILIPYCIAVGRQDVIPGLPYISDTGTKPPESCVFGQLLNMTAAAALACIYIRYKQVQVTSEGNPRVSFLNNVGLVLGMLACLGMSLVANFQETNVLAVHMIGAMMCFGIGSIYTIVHTWITFRLRNRGCITCLRLFLSVASIFLFVLTFTFSNISLKKHGHKNPLHWDAHDGGFAEHQVATTSEWLLAISFLAYFWTFIPEFRWLKIAVEVESVYLRLPGVNIPASDMPPSL